MKAVLIKLFTDQVCIVFAYLFIYNCVTPVQRDDNTVFEW